MCKRRALLLCLALCLFSAGALAGADYQWTADDYVWSLRSKRVNNVPIGDALEYAYPDANWTAGVADDGSGDVLGLFQGSSDAGNFALLVRFDSYFSFSLERGELNGRVLDNPSQPLLEALQAYYDSHICAKCAGLGYVDACLNCAGSGYAYGKTCLGCGGTGKYSCDSCRGYGVITGDYTRRCPFCDGTGSGGKCATCKGGGYGIMNGMILMCTDCLGSGEATCAYCSSNGSIKLGYLAGS